ncbi:BMP family ABC transporter substrate-binding protein [Romboutsia weinsteinii]|uniref:BMP family ABC transporter substrate-binding protein n=1 Tax=Romboutsia weinsteinii TaxID=2020949 RepID=A0A371IXQ7_9FIRM|nr:BMP family ABC transporter substrate-binding protein [Romboutsia weinsteinii]RDY25254.1 BMP family ABC transporter substrate-binding protein [Romboutsia weinsteinii]
MKKKKLLALMLTISIGIGALAGCTPKQNNEENDKDDKLMISLILDKGGVNDQSFNQSAWEGAKKAEEKYGVKVNYIESNQESEYKTNVEEAVDKGADLIIGVGFNLADTIKEASENYPEQKFAIIDGNYENIPKNVRPILFNEEEAGYLVGLISGKVSTSSRFGFIGGMDIPSVSNFAVGYEKGLKEANPNSTLLIQYANSFTDASKGKAIANKMFSDGADIIFTAGGGVNAGAYEAGQELDKLLVAVDMPQNYILPDTILTSALKNVGTGVELTIKDLLDGNFDGGKVAMFDLSNGGVGYEKTKLIPDDVIKFVESKINK